MVILHWYVAGIGAPITFLWETPPYARVYPRPVGTPILQRSFRVYTRCSHVIFETMQGQSIDYGYTVSFEAKTAWIYLCTSISIGNRIRWDIHIMHALPSAFTARCFVPSSDMSIQTKYKRWAPSSSYNCSATAMYISCTKPKICGILNKLDKESMISIAIFTAL